MNILGIDVGMSTGIVIMIDGEVFCAETVIEDLEGFATLYEDLQEEFDFDFIAVELPAKVTGGPMVEYMNSLATGVLAGAKDDDKLMYVLPGVWKNSFAKTYHEQYEDSTLATPHERDAAYVAYYVHVKAEERNG